MGCLSDFMILSAILDYELSLRYDIRASVLKLLWCLDDPKGIDKLFVTLNFVNVWMPQWFYDLECYSRLWIVTQIWYMSLVLKLLWSFHDPKELKDIICPIKFRKSWAASVILKKTTFCKCWDASEILWSWV